MHNNLYQLVIELIVLRKLTKRRNVLGIVSFLKRNFFILHMGLKKCILIKISVFLKENWLCSKKKLLYFMNSLEYELNYCVICGVVE